MPSTTSKVTRSYRPGLFHGYAVPDLPRTNNDLEHEFGSQRYHERRATGRKTASPAAVLRGEARLVAAIATRQRAPSGSDLGCVIGNSGKSSGSVSIDGARRISCAPASGVIPPPIWRHWRKMGIPFTPPATPECPLSRNLDQRILLDAASAGF